MQIIIFNPLKIKYVYKYFVNYIGVDWIGRRHNWIKKMVFWFGGISQKFVVWEDGTSLTNISGMKMNLWFGKNVLYSIIWINLLVPRSWLVTRPIKRFKVVLDKWMDDCSICKDNVSFQNIGNLWNQTILIINRMSFDLLI